LKHHNNPPLCSSAAAENGCSRYATRPEIRLCREEVRVYMFCSTLSMVSIKSCFDKQPRHAEISVSQHIPLDPCLVSSIPTAQLFSRCPRRPPSRSKYQETSKLSSLSHQWNRQTEKGQVQVTNTFQTPSSGNLLDSRTLPGQQGHCYRQTPERMRRQWRETGETPEAEGRVGHTREDNWQATVVACLGDHPVFYS
jgi:hypothetical protein